MALRLAALRRGWGLPIPTTWEVDRDDRRR
jgi:hypothetical protein